MLIKSIKLKNIRSYLDEKISFPDGSVLLSGDIGSGKSTILLALDFALFGIRRGELEGDALLRHGTDDGSIELEFESSGSIVKIKRTLKRKKSVNQDSGEITIDGIKTELSPNELKAKIYDLLGYPQDIITKNKPIFRYTVYTPQEEMKHILLYPDERLEILRKIFGIDKYGLIRENARLMMTEIRSMKREIEAYTRDLDEKINQKQDKEKEKIQIFDDIRKQERLLCFAEETLTNKKAELDDARKRIEGMIKIKHELDRKQSELVMKEKRKRDIKNEIADYSTKIHECETKLKQYAGIEQNLQDLRKTLLVMQRQRDDAIKTRAVLQNELRKLNDILEKGICSFCGQDVYDREGFRNNINDKNLLEKTLNESIQMFEDEINESQKKITMLERKEHVENSLGDIKKWKNNRDFELNEIENEILERNTDIEALKPELESFDDKKRYAEIIENDFEKIQREKNDIEKEVARLEQQIKNADTLISLLQTEIESKKRSREKMIYYDELVKWLDVYFIKLMETIEKHVMYNIQQEFNKFFQEWFEILMGNEMSVRINEQFAPIIEQNGFETDYNNLSGGEKTSVALAYRLSLNKVINIMIDSIKTKDLLILDEPTDGFSMDQLDRMRDVLDKLSLKQVILVSHEPKIDTFVSNVIKIYKDGHVSRVGN